MSNEEINKAYGEWYSEWHMDHGHGGPTYGEVWRAAFELNNSIITSLEQENKALREQTGYSKGDMREAFYMGTVCEYNYHLEEERPVNFDEWIKDYKPENIK